MAKVNLSKTGKIIVTAVAVILALFIAGGSYCIATDQNPVEATKTIFASDKVKLVGKWQSQSAPGLSAYVFYEDGTYDSYLSTVKFSGTYTVKGHEITLVNPESKKEVKYNFNISGKVLTLTALDNEGIKDKSDVLKFDSVDELKQKTINDLIGELVSEKDKESETKAE